MERRSPFASDGWFWIVLTFAVGAFLAVLITNIYVHWQARVYADHVHDAMVRALREAPKEVR